jgi:hypothetical protein
MALWGNSSSVFSYNSLDLAPPRRRPCNGPAHQAESCCLPPGVWDGNVREDFRGTINLKTVNRTGRKVLIGWLRCIRCKARGSVGPETCAAGYFVDHARLRAQQMMCCMEPPNYNSTLSLASMARLAIRSASLFSSRGICVKLTFLKEEQALMVAK